MRSPRQLHKQAAKRDGHTPTQWRNLMRKVIARAKQLKDPRAQMFEESLSQGTFEKVLRRLSIISEADIVREFPNP